MVTLVVLVVAKVMGVEVGSKEVLPVAVILQHPAPAQVLPVAVVLRHPVQAPTPPWPPRVLSKSKTPTSTL